ncbi:MAG TPA: substrate-binding domain-containing protein [Anaerolineaceae bacterium]|nr:substrate-binding domain-containing protein [Anaerolineaceae bacterium]
MDDTFLYEKIAEWVRQEILAGRLKPGDRLPPIRRMMTRWNCTPGTVQRAYRELAQQGLVISRAGQGTRVAQAPLMPNPLPLRRAALVHRAEAFLLEVLTSGYSPAEVETALGLALDRWRSLADQPSIIPEATLRFAGSHDLALARLAAECRRMEPPFTLQLRFTGSLGGLMALAQGEADLAGCHLWDEETDTYNIPFVRRLLPGRRVALIHLAQRRLGLIVPAGNPQNLAGLQSLNQPGVVFINRQPGSGTRVWLDAQLRRLNLPPEQVAGFNREERTHSEVARAVAEGSATVGLGLEGAAGAFGLGFLPLASEEYALAVPAERFDLPAVRALRSWLASDMPRQAFTGLGGYDFSRTGSVAWVE